MNCESGNCAAAAAVRVTIRPVVDDGGFDIFDLCWVHATVASQDAAADPDLEFFVDRLSEIDDDFRSAFTTGD